MEIRKIEMKMTEVITECYNLCDKCGERIKVRIYDAFECTFLCTKGDAYPEGARVTEHRLDLCQKCADKAMALLNKNGYKIVIEKLEY